MIIKIVKLKYMIVECYKEYRSLNTKYVIEEDYFAWYLPCY